MIDLNTWNLTIPVGEPATTIETPLLVGGYQDDYFQNINGALFFWTPVSGSTTPNAKYPRSELRETYADGSLRNWKYNAADNYLRASLKVTQVPSTGKIVIGQIHNLEGDDPPLKLSYQYKSDTRTGNIVAIYRLKPGIDTTSVTVFRDVPLNQSFSYTIRLTPSGTLVVNVKTPSSTTSKWTAKLDPSWATQNLYFKAGSYVQDNLGDASEAGAVNFTNLLIEHL
ncbi:polysaccharide lyase family 7 protein [Pseudomonas sp. R-28-1W-6]|uniref:polysaccharide lyase family 7 protein n=1 Tax=Pseudomonas sp. R-28-1W-6 TaxID=2650101 RepID=UPI00136561F2|nr:polysaccharide lyase family 7 protein [Pseudomonas sp. R-28-1W-6]MWV13085.1 polysaccharide lyase family 7 protein [Pseudomonas sp. R-28-1W-6]